ncbi:hypothetical protein H5P28_04550 [Ruficoccus amylovorans]|uniref:DUF6900 domain-containing protein n=1 Tax=Ruficoccus amylovorans TaxID=1804625 RepID=A0A842HCV1_9BACT|nr:hypothetical protein [Ruficoccus amylovorans]MBC2593526.1 hypothetical protein [Ruficoccus amylovorans]
MKQTLDAIARDILGVPTLKTRNRDALDFHDVAVWGLHDALAQAYRNGLDDQAEVLMHNHPVRFWGFTPESVVRFLAKRGGFSAMDAAAALRSCGIEVTPDYLDRTLSDESLPYAVLSMSQLQALRERAQLYQDHVRKYF